MGAKKRQEEGSYGGRGDSFGRSSHPQARLSEGPCTPTPEKPLFLPAFLPLIHLKLAPCEFPVPSPRPATTSPSGWETHSHLRLYGPSLHPQPLAVLGQRSQGLFPTPPPRTSTCQPQLPSAPTVVGTGGLRSKRGRPWRERVCHPGLWRLEVFGEVQVYPLAQMAADPAWATHPPDPALSSLCQGRKGTDDKPNRPPPAAHLEAPLSNKMGPQSLGGQSWP